MLPIRFSLTNIVFLVSRVYVKWRTSELGQGQRLRTDEIIDQPLVVKRFTSGHVRQRIMAQKIQSFRAAGLALEKT